MIFRRIKAHVAKEDWFAVFIDFIIVVFGVFMGFQVNNWNEARATAKADEQLIGRMINDLKGMREQYVQTEPLIRRMHEGWIHTFRALENCQETPDHRESINFALSQYQRSAPIGVQRSAFDEMKSIGAFSRIKNVDLQNQISVLYAGLDGQAESDNIGRNNQLAAGRIMWKSIAFSFSSDDPGHEEYDTWATAAFDPLAHCDNLELRGAVWELVDVNRDWLDTEEDNDAFMETILSQLEDLK